MLSDHLLPLGEMLALAGFTTVFLAAVWTIYSAFFHPIAHIPGPMLAKFAPVWAMRSLQRRRFNSDLQGLHNKYGSAVRIGPNEVSFASVESQTTIYSKDNLFTKKGTFIHAFSELVLNAPTLISTADPVLHKRLHRVTDQAFTPKALNKQEPIQNSYLDDTISRLKRDADLGNDVDLVLTLETTVWDILGDLAFGEPLTRGKKPTWEWLKTMGKKFMPVIELLSWLITLPGGNSFLRLIALVAFRSPLSQVVSGSKLRDCMERQDGREDFLTAIMGGEKQGLSMNSDAIFDNSVVLLLAGYQTTATTLSASFYYILRHPHIYDQLRKEVREGFPIESEMTGERLQRLQLLNGCVREVLRLLPAANGKTSQRTTPACTIGGVYVPAGTRVSSDVYSIHRSSKYFYDPASFRPERWYDNGEGTEFKNDNRLAWRPFSLGTRACIGRNMAQQSLRLTIARMMWNFDFELLNKDFVWEEDAGSSFVYTDYDVRVRVKHRTGKGMMKG